MRFSKAKYNVLHLSQGSPHYQYRLGDEEMESSPAGKELGVLVDEKLDTTWLCVLAARRPTASWAASREAWPAS